MPVSLTFSDTPTVTAKDESMEVLIPVTWGNMIRRAQASNIHISPDATDPVSDMEYGFVVDGSDEYVCMNIPIGNQGTMEITGTGEVYRTDTNAYDTINTGIATLEYDTRLIEVIFRDIQPSYASGDTFDFIIGLNRDVTITAPIPNMATEVFIFDGANLGTSQVWAYVGTGDPRLPLPADLMAATDWELMSADTYSNYFAVRFTNVLDTAHGAVNIYLRENVLATDDDDFDVTAIAPPQPQMQNVPVIENIADQFLTLTENFEVRIGITGGTATSAYVRGLANGSEAELDEDNQEIVITGNANKLLTDSTWRCFASGADGDAEPVNQKYNYVEATPVITQLTKQTIYTDDYNEIIVPIANIPAEGTVTMELVGMNHELWDDDLDGLMDSMRIWGTPSGQKNYTITEGRADIMVMNTGGDASGFFEYDLKPGAPVFVFNDSTDAMYKIATDGSLAWTYTALPSGAYYIPAASSDGGVFAFLQDTYDMYKIATDGSLAWTNTDLPSGIYPAPLRASSDGGIFAIRNNNGNVYKLASDGSLAWTYTALSIGSYDSPVASSDGGVFVFRDDTDDVYKIASDGSLAWTYTALPIGNYEFPVASSDGGVLLLDDTDDDVYKLASDGSLAWTYTGLPTATYDSPVASSDGGVFIFRDDTDDVYKLASDGTLAWTYTALPIGNYEFPVASSDGGVLLLDDTDDDVYKLASDGSLAWTYTGLPTATYDSPVASSDGGVFIFRDDTDDVYKLASDGTLAWTYTALPTAAYDTPVAIPVIFL